MVKKGLAGIRGMMTPQDIIDVDLIFKSHKEIDDYTPPPESDISHSSLSSPQSLSGTDFTLVSY